jgi:hypothetical protein
VEKYSLGWFISHELVIPSRITILPCSWVSHSCRNYHSYIGFLFHILVTPGRITNDHPSVSS